MKKRNWLSKAELLEIDLNTSPDRYNVDIRQITQMSLWSSYFQVTLFLTVTLFVEIAWGPVKGAGEPHLTNEGSEK